MRRVFNILTLISTVVFVTTAAWLLTAPEFTLPFAFRGRRWTFSTGGWGQVWIEDRRGWEASLHQWHDRQIDVEADYGIRFNQWQRDRRAAAESHRPPPLQPVPALSLPLPRSRPQAVHFSLLEICFTTWMPPLFWYLLVLRREKRSSDRLAAGCCVACGYDLRSTPDRCPECGRESTGRARRSSEARP